MIHFKTTPPVSLSTNAVATLEAVGAADLDSIQTDLDDLRSGAKTVSQFREECLAGADGSDVIAGWTEYVDALSTATHD